MTEMNIIDFCDKHGINWFPISLTIQYDEKKGKNVKIINPIRSIHYFSLVKSKTQKYKSYRPKTTDFETLSVEEIQERQNLYKNEDTRKQYELTHIAMETNKVFQVDIDTPDYQDGYKDLMEKTPFNKSSSKSYGRHIFITDKDFKPTVPKDVFQNNKDVELLCGLWSWAPADGVVYNADKPILEVTGLNTFVNGKVIQTQKKKEEATKPKIKPKQSIDSKATPADIDLTKIKPEDKELADIIDLKYIDNYDDWTKLIWACCVDDNFELAHYISSRGNKYDGSAYGTQLIYENYTDSRNGFSKATFYHYAKISDHDKYTEIRAKHHPFTEINGLTDNDLAKTFCKLYGCDHIYYDKVFYYFNGVLWVTSESGRHLKKSITNDLSSFYLKEATRIQKQIALSEDETQQQILKKKMDGLLNIVKKIQGFSSMNNIVGMVKMYIEKSSDEVEFETSPYLFAFKDKIYNLKTCEWSEPCRDDFMCISTGYSWVEPTDEDMKTFDEFLNTIFPHPDEKALYMTILATGLCGKTLEKFINANGSGGNGKGVINELAELMFGNYAYNCANAVLLNPIKDGNNPTVANMKHKRIIFYREPDTTEQKKMNIATIKELTGGKAVNARMNYSNDTKTVLVGTHILECNERPKLSGRVDDAVVRRLIDIPFRSVFTSKPEDYFGEYVFKKDDYYKSTEFQTKFRCVMFKTLLKYWKEYRRSGENIDEFICDSVKERTNAYLEANDELKSWFDEHYEMTGNRDDILQIKDIYEDFKHGDTWTNMSKRERREMNKKGFTEKIAGNIHFRKYYKEVEQSKLVKEKYGVSKMRNVLVGFVRTEKKTECALDIEEE